MADIVYNEGIPRLANIDTIVRPADLPSPVNGWNLETQNFRPLDDKELLFNAHFPHINYEAEVMGIDLTTRKIVNYSRREDRYDEPEGIFPDGKSILVESNRHRPVNEGFPGWSHVYLYKLSLDGSGQMERITFFNDNPAFKATNPVVSDDGKFMAFQYSIATEVAGIGHGILIWDFKKAEKARKERINQNKKINYTLQYENN